MPNAIFGGNAFGGDWNSSHGYDSNWWSRLNPTYSKNVASWNPDRGMAQALWDDNPNSAWKTYASNLVDYATSTNHQGGVNTGSVINPFAKQAIGKNLQDAQAMYYLMNFGHPGIGAFNALENTSNAQNAFNFMTDALSGTPSYSGGDQGPGTVAGSHGNHAVGSTSPGYTGGNIAGVPVWGSGDRTQAFSSLMANLAKAANPQGFSETRIDSQGGRVLTPEEQNNAMLSMQALNESPEMVQNMMNYATRGYGGAFGGAVQNILNRAWDNLQTQGVAAPTDGSAAPARTTSDFYNFLSNLWNGLHPGGAY